MGVIVTAEWRNRYHVLTQLPEPWTTAIAEEGSPVAWASELHGPAHWERVAQNSLRLGIVNRADLFVVLAFALIHDAFRQNDDYDPEHGERAADWTLDKKETLGLSKQQLKSLEIALALHDKGRVYESATVGTCWDADRLDLPRVGIRPDTRLFSTVAGQEEVTRLWASRTG